MNEWFGRVSLFWDESTLHVFAYIRLHKLFDAGINRQTLILIHPETRIE